MASTSGANFSMDVTRYTGDTFPEKFELVDEAGTAIDITGRTFVLTVNSEQNPGSGDPDLYQLTGSIVDAEAGTFEFPVSAGQSLSDAGDYHFDIRMTFNPGSGTVSKVIGGGDWHIIQGIS